MGIKKTVVFATLFFAGFILVFLIRVAYVRFRKPISFIAGNITFGLKPPAQALDGVLMYTEGGIFKKGRDGNEFSVAEIEEQVQEGDVVKTESDGSGAVEFNGFGRVELFSDSEVLLSNSQRQNFLVVQRAGSVIYSLSDPKGSLTVRALHVLFEFDGKGTAVITIDASGDEIEIAVEDGSGKIALVDLTNNTKVYDVREGERAVIDDLRHEVDIN